MINNLYDFHQRVKTVLPVFVTASLFISPLFFALFCFLLAGLRWASMSKQSAMCIFAGACAVDALVVLFAPNTMMRAIPADTYNWLVYPSSVRLLVPLATTLGISWVGGETADDILLRREEKRRRKHFRYSDYLDCDDRTHAFVAGTTGAGKTTALTHYIEDSLRNGEQVYILSGKNGSADKHSLMRISQALSYQYDRDFILVSVNQGELTRRRYNPLEGMTPTEAADALVSISDYTEPHYKACTATWVKAVCEVLQTAGIPLSLPAICDFFLWDDFSDLVDQLKEQGEMPEEQAISYRDLKDVAKEASLSRSRYENLIRGEGRDLFNVDDPKLCVNATMAKQSEGVFFVDLDSFRYSDFTSALGKLFISDVRHVVGDEIEMHARKRIIMDELGAYATELLMPLFAQARSYGYQIIVATQSLADLENVSESFARRVLENCGQYVIFRLNDAADAETIANIIGTRETIETTRKSDGDLLDGKSAGTKKVVREYKVGPDVIKELPPLTCVHYCKSNPEAVMIVKLDYVKITKVPTLL